MRSRRPLLLALVLLMAEPAPASAEQAPAAAEQVPPPSQEAPKPPARRRRPPTRRPTRVPVPDTTKAPPAARAPQAPPPDSTRPPASPADSTRPGGAVPVSGPPAAPAAAPADTAPPAAVADSAAAAVAGDSVAPGAPQPAPLREPEGPRDGLPAPAPRGAWRVGVGALSTVSRLLVVNDGVNPDVVFSGGPAVLLEGEFRVAGPLRLYATAGAAQGQINHSGALDVTLRPPRPTYGAVVGLGSAGLLLQPTFGGAVLQPYLRGGGGVKGYMFDFPGERRFAAAPTFDVGAGLRLAGGRVGGFLEGRWLRSFFLSERLPTTEPPADVLQNDLLLVAGVRVTR